MSDPPARLSFMSSAAPVSESPIQGLDRSVAVIAAASADCLRDVAQIDDRRLWERDGATSMSSWLAGRYNLAWGTAREWVRVAHALRGLPRIAEAYARGEISWDQLRPLTKFATSETDALWVHRAPRLRPWTLHREAARHRRVERRQAEDARRLRSVRLYRDFDLPLVYLEATPPR